MPENDLLHGFLIELRRGSLTLAVLGSLKTPHYGYALLQTLQDTHIPVEANTLYPLLRRLEGQGLLQSDWDTTESRPRKYYSLSELGREIYAGLLEEWEAMGRSIERICQRGDDA